MVREHERDERSPNQTAPLALRREVVMPIAHHRQPSSVIGISLLLLLLASALDALVWTYHAKRSAEQRALSEQAGPSLTRQEAARLRQLEVEVDAMSARIANPPTIGHAPEAPAPLAGR